jgi:lipopolysaccharide transport system ATP-binding protein
MFSNEVVISAENLGKAYRLYTHPQDRLKHTLFWRFGRDYGQIFWALRDVSFELRRGEMLGIVGRNGSGKSTLLQMLAGTLHPTAGSVQITGRVAALLELGSGFNPEFNGLENIYLNAAMLGLSRSDVEKKIDAIIAFADIGEFIEQPVKLYSSGMFVRLAFAVTTGLDPDILLVDEALAVGDIFFRQKCYQRLNGLREKGTAIILVTHNMVEVEQFCSRALLMQHGHLLFQGSATETVKRYYLLEQEDRNTRAIETEQPEIKPPPAATLEASDHFWPDNEAFLNISNLAQVSNGWADCTGVALCDENGRPCLSFSSGEKAVFYYEFIVHHELGVPISGIVLQNDKGVIVHGKNSLQQELSLPHMLPAGSKIRFRQEIELDLQSSEYTFEVGLVSMRWEDYQRRNFFPPEELRAHFTRICHIPNIGPLSVTLPIENGIPYATHYGVANLDGNTEVYLIGE